MTEQEMLLSDEFAEFSNAIALVHHEKKILEEEFKKHFDAYKAKKKEFEARVADASAKWEDWKKSQSSEKK